MKTETPKTDDLSAFLATHVPGSVGNILLHQKLLVFEQLERDLAEAVRERDALERTRDKLLSSMLVYLWSNGQRLELLNEHNKQL